MSLEADSLLLSCLYMPEERADARTPAHWLAIITDAVISAVLDLSPLKAAAR